MRAVVPASDVAGHFPVRAGAVTVWPMSLVTYWKTRTLLGAGAAVGMALGGSVVSGLGFPAAGINAPALSVQPGAVMGVLLLTVSMVVATVLGCVVGGRVRQDAGLFAAAFVLVGVSWWGGGIREAFVERPDVSLYTPLAVETAALGLLVGLCQLLVLLKRRAGLLAGDEHRDGIAAPTAALPQVVLALLLTSVVYALLASLLVASEAKHQALVGVAVAGFLASAGVHFLVAPTAPAWAFWPAPVLAGVAAYLVAGNAYPGVPGTATVTLPLARPLPVDHAGAAVAASLLGYWYSRKWKREGLDPTPDTEDVLVAGAVVAAASASN